MSAEAALAALRASDLRWASKQTLARLASEMTLRNFPARKTVFWEGDPSTSVYLIERGEVWLTAIRPDGSTGFVTAVRSGMMLGEHTALSRRRRVHTATTQTEVVAWDLPVESLRESLRGDTGLAYRVLLSTIDLVLEKNTEAVRRVGQTTKERLASVLLDLHADAEGEGIRLGHAELAMMVGATRESVTRALAQLRDRGAIRMRGREIVVADESVLKMISRRQ